MSSRSLFCIFILNFAVTAAWSKDFIIGGQEVDAPDPVAAATIGIFEPSKDGHSGSLCSGTLIRRDLAVTAAHCIQSGAPSPVVIFGSDLHSPTAIHRPVEAVAVNPKWKVKAGKGMDQGDIALVKFKGGIPEGYRKISTVNSDSEIQSGANVVLAGYGISDARAKTGAGRLRKTEVKILKNRPGKSEMILDQSRGHGACHGDSGGPAFIQQGGRILLAGVTNRGYPDRAPDDCRHQVVYTKVPAYRSWIQKSAKKFDSTPAAPVNLLAKNNSKPHTRSRVLKLKIKKRRKIKPAAHKSRPVVHISRKSHRIRSHFKHKLSL